MFRFRLRSLVVVVALGPPAIAVAWMLATGVRVHPVLLGAATYVFLILSLVAASWGLEWVEKSHAARFILRWPRRPSGLCSYCGEPKRPLAEGPAGVLICRDCAQACLALLDQEMQKQQTPTDSPTPSA